MQFVRRFVAPLIFAGGVLLGAGSYSCGAEEGAAKESPSGYLEKVLDFRDEKEMRECRKIAKYNREIPKPKDFEVSDLGRADISALREEARGILERGGSYEGEENLKFRGIELSRKYRGNLASLLGTNKDNKLQYSFSSGIYLSKRLIIANGHFVKPGSKRYAVSFSDSLEKFVTPIELWAVSRSGDVAVFIANEPNKNAREICLARRSPACGDEIIGLYREFPVRKEDLENQKVEIGKRVQTSLAAGFYIFLSGDSGTQEIKFKDVAANIACLSFVNNPDAADAGLIKEVKAEGEKFRYLLSVRTRVQDGSSGSPLFNPEGELVGVHSCESSNPNECAAVCTETIRGAMEKCAFGSGAK